MDSNKIATSSSSLTQRCALAVKGSLFQFPLYPLYVTQLMRGKGKQQREEMQQHHQCYSENSSRDLTGYKVRS